MSERGCYRDAENYAHLSVALEEWNKMCPNQHKQVVKSFFSAELNPPMPDISSHNGDDNDYTSSNSTGTSDTSTLQLSVSAEDNGIRTLPLSTLCGIWSKATALMCNENAITSVPDTDKSACAVQSY